MNGLFLSSVLYLLFLSVASQSTTSPIKVAGPAGVVTYLRSEDNTYDDLCATLGYDGITDVIVKTSIQFGNQCPMSFLNRLDVRLTCQGEGPHLVCARNLACFDFSKLPSYNSTFITIGCVIVGGGYINVEESFMNVTIQDSTFTTNDVLSSNGFLRFQIVNALPSHYFDSVILRVVNTSLRNIAFSSYATCFYMFIPSDVKGVGSFNLTLINVSVSNLSSSVTPVTVGLLLSDSSRLCRTVTVRFSSVHFERTKIILRWATGAVFLINSTGSMYDMRCSNCVAVSKSAGIPALNAFITLRYAVNMRMNTIVCDGCVADESGVLHISFFSTVSIHNLFVYRTFALLPHGAITLLESAAEIENMYVESSAGVLYGNNVSSYVVNNLSVVGSSGIHLDEEASLRIHNFSFTGGTYNVTPVLLLTGKSKAYITTFLLQNTYAQQLLVATHNSTLSLSSMTTYNVTSWKEGGLFAMYDHATLNVDGLSAFNTTTLSGNGGVVFCGTSQQCVLENVGIIQNAVSKVGNGGFLSTGTAAGSVKLSCAAVSKTTLIEGMSSQLGGCIHVGGGASSIIVKNCNMTSCASCGKFANQNVLFAPSAYQKDSIHFENVVLPRVNIYQTNALLITGSMEAITLNDVHAATTPVVSTISQANCTSIFPIISETSSPSPVNKIVQQHNNGETGATTISQVMTTAGSMLLISSEIVLATQSIHLAQCGRQNGDDYEDTSSSFRRPIISLGRVFPDNSGRRMGDGREAAMVFLTNAVVYSVHLIATAWVSFFSQRKKKNKNSKPSMLRFSSRWLRGVAQFSYPGSWGIRYHISLLLPLVSLCTIMLSVGNQGNAIVLFGTIWYVAVLCLFHFSVSTCGSLQYEPSTAHSVRNTRFRHFVPSGRWNPKSIVAMGGPFFSSYSHGGYYPPYHPHGWIWVTIGVGIIMSVTSTLAEVRDPNKVESLRTCSISAICCGLVTLGCGVFHMIRVTTLMTVRATCWLRGVRLVLTGLTLGVMGTTHFANESSILLVMGDVLTYSAAGLSVVEGITSLVTRLL
eukprot:PhF_6_TR37475/c0_g1_i1/m.55193